MIEDIGSMHGTYLNNIALPPNTAKAIGDADEVKFGAEVRRGPENFPACRFRFNYEFVPYKYVQGTLPWYTSLLTPADRAANTFEFPEYSDIDEEEEEEFEFSDQADGKGHLSSEDSISIESPVPSATKANDPIDLTRDDSPIRNDLIDLTEEETPAERQITNLLAGRPADITESADRHSIAVYAGNPLTVEDSEDEDTHFSSDSDDRLEDADAEDADSSGSGSSSEDHGLDEVHDDYPDSDIDIEEVDGFESDDGYPEEYPMEDDQEDAVDDSSMRNIHRFAHATNENSTFRLTESLPAGEPSEDDDDNESDFGLAEAGAEGMRVLYEGGLLEKLPEQAALPTPNAEIHVEIDRTPQTTLSVGMPPITIAERAPEDQSTKTLFHSTHREIPMPYLSFRQPSPSDAAMVKTQVAPATTPISAPVQSLGDVTGKGAFFEAREVNKVNLRRFAEPSEEQLGNNPIPKPFAFGSLHAPQFDSVGFVCSMCLNSEAQNTGLTDSAMPTRDECSFLDRPDITPVAPRAPSPIPDMTSAMTYTASKDSIAAAAKSVTKPRVLKIQDMCDRPLATPVSLKRKAQEISSASDEELRIWANGTSHDVQNTSANTTLANHDSVNTASDKPLLTVNLDIPRPTKRFRKFMERVAYMAVGGVAFGAIGFSALVATAPSYS